MKVYWYRSATVGIISNNGTSILCDPWITNGAFIGSWYHWPPLEGHEFNSLTNTKWDAIYISHLHADHFDRKLVAQIARNQPEAIAIIPKFSHPWLKRAVENCGFQGSRLVELDGENPYMVGDISVRVFKADHCDPRICGVSTPCHDLSPRESSIDSLALFEADVQRILNANDALAVQSALKLWPLIGKVDLLLGHYGGAGPFPQTFVDLSVESKIEKARTTGMVFVNRLSKAANDLSAKYVMPYAGQYVLGGRLSELNEYRSVIPLPEVFEVLRSSCNAKPVSINPFGYFDLDAGLSSQVWSEPSPDELHSYIDDIKTIKYPYELENENWPEGKEMLIAALENVEREFLLRVGNGTKGSNSTLTILAGSLKQNINFYTDYCDITSGDAGVLENRTIIEFDPRLLRRIITRRKNYKGFTQFHFNQAEIGSHLIWRRTGNYPWETALLNFMYSIKKF
jgi:UDP-MurNAc hydroxylase